MCFSANVRRHFLKPSNIGRILPGFSGISPGFSGISPRFSEILLRFSGDFARIID